MKGTLIQNRHVLLLEQGVGGRGGWGGELTAFIIINKIEHFTERLS